MNRKSLLFLLAFSLLAGPVFSQAEPERVELDIPDVKVPTVDFK